jgi:hypothetical protein
MVELVHVLTSFLLISFASFYGGWLLVVVFVLLKTWESCCVKGLTHQIKINLNPLNWLALVRLNTSCIHHLTPHSQIKHVLVKPTSSPGLIRTHPSQLVRSVLLSSPLIKDKAVFTVPSFRPQLATLDKILCTHTTVFRALPSQKWKVHLKHQAIKSKKQRQGRRKLSDYVYIFGF